MRDNRRSRRAHGRRAYGRKLENGGKLDFSAWLTAGLALVAGALLGASLYPWWLRNNTEKVVHPLVPDKWPLAARSLLTSEEHAVLQWLNATFHDHIVMLKVPVLRFTVPTHKAKDHAAKGWQELLNGVYCTYTVCTPQGQVVGCVDLPGKRGLSQGSRELKEKLLSDCGLAYTVVLLADLPKATAMRAAFLGEAQEQAQPPHQTTRGGDSNFQADLASFNKRSRQLVKNAALVKLNHKPGKAP